MERASRLLTALTAALVFLLPAPGAQAATVNSRIKDIARLAGVRDNQLGGYGLVVGLKGTGDRNRATFTVQSLLSMLSRQGIRVPAQDVRVRNVAAVMVTATLPPFARNGDRIDIHVSSIGDSESLQGGTLLLTPLRGPDGQVYAVAQGPMSVGGFSGSGRSGSSVRKNHDAAGSIAGGALVEREVPASFAGQTSLTYILSDPDFTTATKLADAVNETLLAEWNAGEATRKAKSEADKQAEEDEKKAEEEAAEAARADGDEKTEEEKKKEAEEASKEAPAAEEPKEEEERKPPESFARVLDGANISISIPESYKDKVPVLVAKLEQLVVATDRAAKVVLNERTGTIIIGADVRISTVAIAHGGLTITVRESSEVSQPAPFSGGGAETEVVPQTEIEVKEQDTKLRMVQGDTDLGQLVEALNALGATPRDLVAILQALKKAGALNAELEVI
jgi:flagellar P-ring protein precursor FlgI